MMQTHTLTRLIGVTSLLLLASCQNSVSSDVVAFHESPMPNGETITVAPSDPAKAQSLEFRSYANLIGEQLAKLGYNYVEEPNTPSTLVAEVDYSVEAGPTDVQLDQPLQPYVRYHFSNGRYYDPFYFGYNNWAPQTYTTATYLRNLTVNIVENDATRERVFEGRVQSRGLQNQLPEIMPYLVTAMFRNFPGENGVTKVVTLERDE